MLRETSEPQSIPKEQHQPEPSAEVEEQQEEILIETDKEKREKEKEDLISRDRDLYLRVILEKIQSCNGMENSARKKFYLEPLRKVAEPELLSTLLEDMNLTEEQIQTLDSFEEIQESAMGIELDKEFITGEWEYMDKQLGDLRNSVTKKLISLLKEYPDQEIERELKDPESGAYLGGMAIYLGEYFARLCLKLAQEMGAGQVQKLQAFPEPERLEIVGALIRIKKDLIERKNSIDHIYKTEEEVLSEEHIDEKSESLKGEVLLRQIELRQKYFESIYSNHLDYVSDLIIDPDYKDKRNLIKNAGRENHVFLPGFYLAPNWTTLEFIQRTKELLQQSRTLETFNQLPEISEFEFITRQKNLSLELQDIVWRDFIKQGRFNSWQGKVVFEIGGSDAADALVNLGAGKVKPADAGHSGYSLGYSAGKIEDMIHLGNYSQYAGHHSVDAVLFSRVLEAGTGVDRIADTISSSEATGYGIKELALVSSNVLKENGVVLTDNALPEEFSQEIGFQRDGFIKAHVAQGVGCNIYHLTDQVDTDYLTLGNKRIRYDSEQKIWQV